MNGFLSLTIIFLLTLMFAPLASANTTIEISNNSGSSTNSVNVRNNTTTSNGTSQSTSTTRIIIDGKEVVNETKESTSNNGTIESNVTVKKEGNAEPTVIIEHKKADETQKEVKKLTDEKKKEIEAKIEQKKKETDEEMQKRIAEHKEETNSIMKRMESLFTHLKSLFSNK